MKEKKTLNPYLHKLLFSLIIFKEKGIFDVNLTIEEREAVYEKITGLGGKIGRSYFIKIFTSKNGNYVINYLDINTLNDLCLFIEEFGYQNWLDFERKENNEVSQLVNGFNYSNLPIDISEKMNIKIDLRLQEITRTVKIKEQLVIEQIGNVYREEDSNILIREFFQEGERFIFDNSQHLLRIEGCHYYGKRTLFRRLQKIAYRNNIKIAEIKFGEFETRQFQSTEIFFQSICESIANSLGIQLLSTFQDNFSLGAGAIQNAQSYIQNYIFPKINSFVLCVNDLSYLYNEKELFNELMKFLRIVYNNTITNSIWGELKIIFMYEPHYVNVIHDINQSPFNVGQTIEINRMSQEESFLLIDSYNIFISDDEKQIIYKLTGGHPYLLTLTLAHLRKGNNIQSISKGIKINTEIYEAYLNRLKIRLEHYKLIKPLKNLINKKTENGYDEIDFLKKLDIIQNNEEYFCTTNPIYEIFFKNI